MKRFLSALVAFAVMGLGLAAQPKLSADNIAEVVAALSPAQKACLVVGFNSGCEGYDPGLPGTGGITYPLPEFGIPSIVMMDGPVGVRLESDWHDGLGEAHFTTCFPTGLLVAASWDKEVAGRMGRGIGEECLSMGADVILGPGMNLLRNPLCGRNFEYFSEDPLLSGVIAGAYVNGVQETGVGACVKHFAANNQETNRLDGDSRLGTRALRELYTRGFEFCLRESDPWTLMASYNKLNGVYTQESRDLLTGILRDDWGYRGLVVTDWTGLRNTPRQLNAGSDLFMGGDARQTKHILKCLEDGTLDMADLDRAVTKVLELIVKTPAFRGHKPSLKPDLEGHAALARELATEGMVLLKNEGALPLSSCKVALFGVTSYDLIPGGNGAAYVSCPYVSQLNDGLKAAGFAVDPELEKLYCAYAPYAAAEVEINNRINVHVGKARGPELVVSKDLISRKATEGDVAVITLGRTSGEARDRVLSTDYYFSEVEVGLVRDVCSAFHSAGKKVVVVLNICGPVDTEAWSHWADAILCAWLPGEEGGNAIADVVSGKVNPSGKLPMSFYLDYFDAAGAENFPYNFVSNRPNESAAHPERRGMDPKNISYTDYEEDVFVGYRDLYTSGKSAAYPFGFGLSYTTFLIDDPHFSIDGDTVKTDVFVQNTGSVPGREVVAVYVEAPLGSFDRKPYRELRAFKKTKMLSPGELVRVELDFPVQDLASFDSENSRWEVAAGEYVIRFGSDCTTPVFKRIFRVSVPEPIYLPVTRACEPK